VTMVTASEPARATKAAASVPLEEIIGDGSDRASGSERLTVR
jgi:hypothetical protein